MNPLRNKRVHVAIAKEELSERKGEHSMARSGIRMKRIVLCLLFLAAVHKVTAAIAWEIELLSDPNTHSTPLASCAGDEAGRIYVVTKVGPRGVFLHKEGDCILWEIGEDGRILCRTLLKDKNGNTIRTNALNAGLGCAMAADRPGNLMTAGVLGEQRKERSLAVILKTDTKTADPNILWGSRIDNFSIQEMVSLPDGTFALIGARRREGVYVRIDNQGKILREVPFDMGQTEIFSGAAQIKPDNLNLSVVGLSVGKPTGESKEYSADNFIRIYDPNDRLIHEDYFAGDYPEMSALLPKVCCLDKGNLLMVFYKKNKKEDKVGLRARCYSPELELLWEKDLFSIEQKSLSFDVASNHLNGFVVAIPSLEGLKFYSFNENAGKTGYSEYKGMVGAFGFNLIRVGDKTIAVFEEGGPGSIEELTIKAKVMACD